MVKNNKEWRNAEVFTLYRKGLSLRQTEHTTLLSVQQDPASYEEYILVKSRMLFFSHLAARFLAPFVFWRASSATTPTQACDTSDSCQKVESRTMYLFLRTCLTVPADPESLGCVFQTQLPKHVWLPSASPNCWVRFPSPWRALLKGTEPTQHAADGNSHNRHILTADDSLSWMTEMLLRAPSPAMARACWRPCCHLRPWRSSRWIARKDQKLEVEVSGASSLGLLLTKGTRENPNQNKPTKPSLCNILL